MGRHLGIFFPLKNLPDGGLRETVETVCIEAALVLFWSDSADEIKPQTAVYVCPHSHPLGFTGLGLE